MLKNKTNTSNTLLILTIFFSISSDHLFSDQFYIEIASTSNLQNIISNGTILLTVISYKNLTNYLPRMYFQRNG